MKHSFRQNRGSVVDTNQPVAQTSVRARHGHATPNRGRRPGVVLRAYIPVDRGRSAIATGTPLALCMTGPADPAARSAAVRSHLVAGDMTRAAPAAAASRRADTTLPGPATPGRRRARPDDRSQTDPPAVIGFEARRAARNHDGATGTRWCCPGCQQHAAASAVCPPRGAGRRAVMPMPAGPGRDVPCSQARSRQRTANR